MRTFNAKGAHASPSRETNTLDLPKRPTMIRPSIDFDRAIPFARSKASRLTFFIHATDPRFRDGNVKSR